MSEIIDTQAIVLFLQPYGESSAIITTFTQKAGLLKGYVKNARSKKNAGIYQKGNLLNIVHSRRLIDQLGTINADLLQCLWQELSYNRLYFKIFNIVCDLKNLILSDHVYEPVIYDSFMALLALMQNKADDLDVKRAYIDYLLIILQQMGFSPDFTKCSVSGVKHDLIYVSPKSAHTISKDVGQAYHDRLILLPSFLQDYALDASFEALEQALKIMQLFYDKFIFSTKDTHFNLML